jgi:hypothetical protein
MECNVNPATYQMECCAGILSDLKPRVLAETLGYWPKP